MSKQTFSVPIKERYRLNPGSEKETYHLVLDLKDTDIHYEVGDCLGIYPENHPEQVNSLLTRWDATGHERVSDREGNSHVLSDFLRKRANLARLPSSAVNLEQFCTLLSPLLPRFYSIASSQSVVGKEAHLTIGLIDGLCTDFLCKRTLLGEHLSLFHHPARNFSLPQDSWNKPLIMIGPGTGVAPFRGFMQERLSKGSSTQNWLFFGDRHAATDFYYKNEWEAFVSQGKLLVDTAFSRDQPEKIYVQHRMAQKSQQLWQWIQEGAYLFVCGDASRMAKDVDKTLLMIFESVGKMTLEQARAFIKELKKSQRYQRDVY